jgi:hypothetical protein
MGRKKRERPAKTVRLDADLITKCKSLADDQGTDVSNYLSALIRPVIEREWVKFQRRMMGGEKS